MKNINGFFWKCVKKKFKELIVSGQGARRHKEFYPIASKIENLFCSFFDLRDLTENEKKLWQAISALASNSDLVSYKKEFWVQDLKEINSLIKKVINATTVQNKLKIHIL